MKLIKQQREFDSYQCDGCEKVYYDPTDAEACERRDRCQHTNIEYRWLTGTHWTEPKYGIESICPNCNKEEKVIDLDEITSDQLAAIVALVKGSQP